MQGYIPQCGNRCSQNIPRSCRENSGSPNLQFPEAAVRITESNEKAFPVLLSCSVFLCFRCLHSRCLVTRTALSDQHETASSDTRFRSADTAGTGHPNTTGNRCSRSMDAFSVEQLNPPRQARRPLPNNINRRHSAAAQCPPVPGQKIFPGRC